MNKQFTMSLYILFFLSLLGATDNAQALAFRCDTFLIDVGMHKIEVLKKCGNPAMSAQRIERRRLGSRQLNTNQNLPERHSRNHTHRHGHDDTFDYEQEIETQIEEWVYNFGPQRFMQLLVFENGRLSQIQDLDWGK